MSPSVAIDILPELCMAAGLTTAETVFVMRREPSKDRHPTSVAARSKLVVYLRDEAGMSYPECAKVVGSRSHASALYLYRLGKSFGAGGEG